MRLYSSLVAMMAILGGASAAKSTIFIPVDLSYNSITLNPDWTIDRTDKDGFAENHGWHQMAIPGDKGSEFAVTGVMDWNTGDFGEKRAFWASASEPPYLRMAKSENGSKYDASLLCRPKQGAGTNNVLYSPSNRRRRMFIFSWLHSAMQNGTWTWFAKKDRLDINWLQCQGKYGEWDDRLATKPDDTWS